MMNAFSCVLCVTMIVLCLISSIIEGIVIIIADFLISRVRQLMLWSGILYQDAKKIISLNKTTTKHFYQYIQFKHQMNNHAYKVSEIRHINLLSKLVTSVSRNRLYSIPA